METNVGVGTLTPVNEEKKIKRCPICGKSYDLSHFKKRGLGYSNVCKHCENGETERSEKFKNFESVELINELRLRGYSGTLTKKIVRTVQV